MLIINLYGLPGNYALNCWAIGSRATVSLEWSYLPGTNHRRAHPGKYFLVIVLALRQSDSLYRWVANFKVALWVVPQGAACSSPNQSSSQKSCSAVKMMCSITRFR